MIVSREAQVLYPESYSKYGDVSTLVCKMRLTGTSMVVQWLRLCTSTAGAVGVPTVHCIPKPPVTCVHCHRWGLHPRRCCCLVAQLCPTLRDPRLQAPLSIRFSRQDSTRAGCHSLLQGIFLTQGSNPSLLHWQAGSLLRSYQ